MTEHPPRSETRSSPVPLSVVMVVHRMPGQALNTVTSLLPPYQRGVSTDEYEIVVVENASDQSLDPDALADLGGSIRYLLRDEPTGSPATACNHGASVATGRSIALMVDGARMATPGLVRTALDALDSRPGAVVAAPGYHLGSQLQRDPAETGYGSDEEQELLAGINWPADGYRLFDVAVLSGSCSAGYLLPMAESNFLAMPRDVWDTLGGVDTRFASPGGGFVNLDLYRRAAEHTGEVVILPGEGTFHQYHAGVTTGKPGIDREILLVDLEAEYRALRGRPFAPPATRPVLFGRVPDAAVRFLLFSAQRAYAEACA